MILFQYHASNFYAFELINIGIIIKQCGLDEICFVQDFELDGHSSVATIPFQISDHGHFQSASIHEDDCLTSKHAFMNECCNLFII